MTAATQYTEESYCLSELIDYYEICNRAEGKSPDTITWYSANLKRFNSYIQSRHLPDSTDKINTKLLREYIHFLLKRKCFNNHLYTPVQDKPLSLSSIHGHVRTLKAFFSWLTREDLIEKNIAKDLRPPKGEKKVVSTLSDEEIHTILNSLGSKNQTQARNQTIIMLLLDTGIRIGELINLKTVDVKSIRG